MHKEKIPKIDLHEFDYDLPASRIADYPEAGRDISKLLYADVDIEKIEHKKFSDIKELIPKDSFLILNSTKVIAARLFFKKPTGGKVELLCVDPLDPSVDPQISMNAKGQCKWVCIVGGKNVKEGMTLGFFNEDAGFTAYVEKRFENKAEIKFSWKEKDITFSQILEKYGNIPLPPYIKRDAEESDSERYQTVYARSEGSVAAPTAGLHFTEEILDELVQNKNVKKREVLLHVGPGTFVPVEGEVREHQMHKERIFVEKSFIRDLKSALAENRDIIATGTTSVRTVESLYQLGLKLISGKSFKNGELIADQWDPYQLEQSVEPEEAIDEILKFMGKENIKILTGETRLFIVPGYNYKFINGIITNYHLPKSTLMLLVAAFAGDFWKKIYSSALENAYRFLSYGDSSFLFRKRS